MDDRLMNRPSSTPDFLPRAPRYNNARAVSPPLHRQPFAAGA